MVRGRLIRYDEISGYGFAAPDDGGDDVFVHVNDLEFDKRQLGEGAVLQFLVEDDGRGPRASQIRLAEAAATSPADDLCDVLTPREFTDEVTEALLDRAPTLRAGELLAVREHLLFLARDHGWVDP